MQVEFLENLKINSKGNVLVFVSEEALANLENIGFLKDLDVVNVLDSFKFKAKEKSVCSLRAFAGFKQVVFAGLGKEEKIKERNILQTAGLAFANFKEEEEVNVYIVSNDIKEVFLNNILLGFELKSWGFDKYLTNEKLHRSSKVKKINFINLDEGLLNKEEITAIQEGVNLARTLVSEPADVLYPASYVKIIEELRDLGVEVEILDKKQLESEGMGALLAVSKGSDKEPYVVIMKYNGNPDVEERLAFVGKGVTYDSGGYSLKPAMALLGMKKDMAGSAAVVGLIKTLAMRKAKVNVVGAVGLVENLINGSSMKVDDILTSMSGKTIEILNTDAEGRLVLADVLWYTQKNFKPNIMINLATLTGAIIVSLGTKRAGLFSNDDDLAKKLYQSGEKTGELVWHMPIGDEYKKGLKSKIADLQNISLTEKGAGSTLAAMFLQEFVNDTKWAHLDIAGTTMLEGDSSINSGASGYGVRLLNEFIKENYEK